MLTQTEEKYVKNVYENIAERFNHTRAYKWKWIDGFFEKLNKNSLVYDIGCEILNQMVFLITLNPYY